PPPLYIPAHHLRHRPVKVVRHRVILVHPFHQLQPRVRKHHFRRPFLAAQYLPQTPQGRFHQLHLLASTLLSRLPPKLLLVFRFFPLYSLPSPCFILHVPILAQYPPPLFPPPPVTFHPSDPLPPFSL